MTKHTKSALDRMSGDKLREILAELDSIAPDGASNSVLVGLILQAQEIPADEPFATEIGSTGGTATEIVKPTIGHVDKVPLAGFTNIKRADGEPTTTWEKKLQYGCSRAIELKEDSGWDATLKKRATALAEACANHLVDRQFGMPLTENLPEFGTDCILEVTVRIVR